MLHPVSPPALLRDVLEDLSPVLRLLEEQAPYTPLGGWFRPGLGDEVPTSPLWFQNDFVHADFVAPGSEIFMAHKRVTETAQRFYDAEVVVPHTLYVNLMAGIEECGPAHTDNPVFEGRNRTNTPMRLLRTMLWSGLFEKWGIAQATSIWWMNDVEGGGFRYWPDGPQKTPQRHTAPMANTALVGDNHGMFHQVEPVGPFGQGSRRVTSRAELAPTSDGSGNWAVTDRGEEIHRGPLETFRISILWKAHIYRNEEERRQAQASPLSLEEVAQIFDRDLRDRGIDFRFAIDNLDDPEQAGALEGFYPEAKPVEAGRSVFDAAN